MKTIDCLIVDDDHERAERVVKCLEKQLPGALTTTVSVCVADALETIRQRGFDVVVLDVHLPLTPDGEPRGDGGLQLFEKIRRWRLPVRHAVFMTRHPDLAAKLKDDAQAVVTTSDTERDWEDRLVRVMEGFWLETQAEHAAHDADVAICTALPDPELRAVLDLPVEWQRVDEPMPVWQASLPRDSGDLKLVAASAFEMGQGASAALATQLVERFRPRILAMSGIAAGVRRQGVEFGDILIADMAFDYGHGKWWSGQSGDREFRPDPRQKPVSARLKLLMDEFRLEDDTTCAKIRGGWPLAKQMPTLSTHMGPFATGAAVVQDPSIIDRIQASQRKVVGIDMEAYGLFVAAHVAQANAPYVLVVKSVSDFADVDKDDDFQLYAAYTSANYLLAFVLSKL